MRRLAALSLSVLLCAAVCASGQPADPGVSQYITQYYEQLIRRGVVSGAAVAVVDHGEVTDISTFGKARLDSLWRAASTSKALTAIGIMRLMERGRVDLDADVNNYLKTLKVPATKSRPITLRQLLTHTSGLDDPFVGSAFVASAGQPPLSIAMRDSMPARLYEPGEVRLYSNFGYGLLGAVIEDVAGERFEDFMRAEVLDPLGMRDSTFQQPLPEDLARRVVPSLEQTVFGSTHPAEILYHRSSSGGGLTTTIGDLLKFAQFIQAGGVIRAGGAPDGGQILKHETLRQMLGASPDRTGEVDTYGFETGINRGERYWYAGGDLGGYHTLILWFPAHDKALVTMATSPSVVATWNLVPKVMESWFGSGKATPLPAASANPHARELTAPVAGTYRSLRYPHFDLGKTFIVTMDKTVRSNGDGSVSNGGERWIAVEPLRFRNAANSGLLTFQEGASGRIRFMNRESERIAWYQSGRAAIAFYFGFVAVSVAILWATRRRENGRALRWMAWAILIHSIAWLGAVLVADPQRLIRGLPWYVTAALAFGAVIPLMWVSLAVSTCVDIFRKSWTRVEVSMAIVLGLYIPFILYWQLTLLPVLGVRLL